jgi:hypothetical protein
MLWSRKVVVEVDYRLHIKSMAPAGHWGLPSYNTRPTSQTQSSPDKAQEVQKISQNQHSAKS